MTNKEQFEAVLERRLERIREVLGVKAGEYATGADRYHNFHQAARMNKETPERALWGMSTKHLVSVKDLVDWTESDPERITPEMADEKIGDMINYLILLEGLLGLRRTEPQHDITVTGRLNGAG